MSNRLSLQQSYWLAFLILAAWATFAFATMYTLIESQKKYGKLINLSGKQRMLSQKTAYYSHLHFHHKISVNELIDLLTVMKKDHRFIINNLPSAQLYDFYFGDNQPLDKQVKQYFQLLSDYMAEPSAEILDLITQNSQPLLINLNQAVTIFEQENEAIVTQLKNRELLIFIGTLLTLILEALLIIKPMLKSHRHYLDKLETEIERQTKDLQIFAKIFENSQEGMIITDEKETILNVNNAFTEVTGYQKHEVLGNTPRILNSGKQPPQFFKKMWQEINCSGSWSGEIINRHKSGEEIYEQLSIIKLIHDTSVYFVCIFTDIGERISHIKELDHLANHDNLTGLLNRNTVINRIEHAIDLANRTRKTLAVLFIDLDNFKSVNDTMGHNVGDYLLIEFAKRFKHCIRQSDTLGRLGGDEFIILLEALDKPGDEKEIIERLQHSIELPFSYKGNELFITASIGIMFFPDQDEEDDISAHHLIRKADLAMYKAKDSGKNKAAYYSKDLAATMTSKLMTEHQLREAIERQELELYLQPKVNVETLEIIGAEALLRWNKDTTIVSPDSFIPIAEESDLIKHIDLWVAKESIYLLGKLKEQGYSELSIAFNLSGRSFSDSKTVDSILDIIYKNNVGQYLEIEITEGVMIENMLFSTNTINKFKSLGISVSLDDFGTGYSSLSYLSQMAFDNIKIDRSFIANIHKHKHKVLTQAIIWFSSHLGMNIIAEGVENKEQLNWLKKEKCQIAQGYFFSKPLPFDEFLKLL